MVATDASVKESAQLNETSRFVVSGILVLKVSSFDDSSLSSDILTGEVLAPLYKDMCVVLCCNFIPRIYNLPTVYQVGYLPRILLCEIALKSLYSSTFPL